MPYNNAIPQPTHKRSRSQPQILANFKAIQSAFEANHGVFDSDDEGKHNFLTLPIQAANPVILATEGALFSKVSAHTALPELFFKRGLAAPIEITSRGNTIHAGGETKGWSYLNSGLLMKFWGGHHVVGPVATYAMPFAGTGPAFTNIFSTIVTLQTGFAENKTIYVKSHTLVGEVITLHTTERYNSNNAIGDFYINILVIGI